MDIHLSLMIEDLYTKQVGLYWNNMDYYLLLVTI